MKTYSEEQLLKAIEYACQYQMGCDYQTAGNLLLDDNSDFKSNSLLLMDALSSQETGFSEIKLSDIFNAE